MDNITIAIDAMGGDFGPKVTVAAAINILKKHKKLHLILVGNENAVRFELDKFRGRVKKRIVIKHASEEVAMDESPSKALRNKKDSSMRVAVNLVKEGLAQACVSAGNTGALMATAKFVLKTLPGVDRPAFVSTVPTIKRGKEVRLLDLGANIDSCADNLYQFAVMGSLLSSAVNGVKSPKVGLLNIGTEEMKGNDLVKHAAQLLSESKHVNYYGYVEGDSIFKGEVDLVVCDGFVGNVALKTMEGLAKLIGFYTKQEFTRSWYTRFIAVLASPVLRRLVKELDPGRRNGASFLGLQGIVIKSHGSANVKAYMTAIEEAILEVEKNIPLLIGETVGTFLEGELY